METLSDKISFDGDSLQVRCVKKFIKQLKEDLKDNVSCLNMREDKIMIDIIDKLAGEKLI